MGYDEWQLWAAVMLVKWWFFLIMLAGCYIIALLGGRLIEWLVHAVFA